MITVDLKDDDAVDIEHGAVIQRRFIKKGQFDYDWIEIPITDERWTIDPRLFELDLKFDNLNIRFVSPRWKTNGKDIVGKWYASKTEGTEKRWIDDGSGREVLIDSPKHYYLHPTPEWKTFTDYFASFEDVMQALLKLP